MSTIAIPGFQTSEHSGVSVVIYRKNGDPIIADNSHAIELNGKSIGDVNHSVVGLQSSKSLGQAGSFSIQLKTSRATQGAGYLFNQVVDDDWVDIFLSRHGTTWHVMRGPLDAIRRQRSGASGTTTVTYNLTGRDFQKVFERTPLYFNNFLLQGAQSAENVADVFFDVDAGNTQDYVVGRFLTGFLSTLSASQRNWQLPESMPNTINSDFGSSFFYDRQNFSNDLDGFGSKALGNSLVSPSYGGSAWSLAEEWSDPSFMELYTELLPVQGHSAADPALNGLSPLQSQMTVVLRNRPFPVMSPGLGRSGQNSPFFSLPLHTIPLQSIVSDDIGQSGDERFNAYFFIPNITVETTKDNFQFLAPLWDPADMQRHGMVRMDIGSRYLPESANLGGLNTKQRARIRDWHCLNGHLFNGTIALAHFRPELKIGNRVCIPGRSSPRDDMTFYLEGVNHSWSLVAGGKTSLTVTRGYQGTDADYLALLSKAVAPYVNSATGQPG